MKQLQHWSYSECLLRLKMPLSHGFCVSCMNPECCGTVQTRSQSVSNIGCSRTSHWWWQTGQWNLCRSSILSFVCLLCFKQQSCNLCKSFRLYRVRLFGNGKQMGLSNPVWPADILPLAFCWWVYGCECSNNRIVKMCQMVLHMLSRDIHLLLLLTKMCASAGIHAGFFYMVSEFGSLHKLGSQFAKTFFSTLHMSCLLTSQHCIDFTTLMSPPGWRPVVHCVHNSVIPSKNKKRSCQNAVFPLFHQTLRYWNWSWQSVKQTGTEESPGSDTFNHCFHAVSSLADHTEVDIFVLKTMERKTLTLAVTYLESAAGCDRVVKIRHEIRLPSNLMSPVGTLNHRKKKTNCQENNTV